MIEPTNAGKNPAIANPGVSTATNPREIPLTINRNNPSVKKVSGRVRRIRTGRTIALTKPNRIAAIIAAMMLSTLSPGTSCAVITRDAAVTSQVKTKDGIAELHQNQPSNLDCTVAGVLQPLSNYLEMVKVRFLKEATLMHLCSMPHLPNA